MYGVWRLEASAATLSACSELGHGELRLAFWLGYRAGKGGSVADNPFRETGGDDRGVRFGAKLIDAWESGYGCDFDEKDG